MDGRRQGADSAEILKTIKGLEKNEGAMVNGHGPGAELLVFVLARAAAGLRIRFLGGLVLLLLP